MKKLKFEIEINSKAENIYQTIIDPDNFSTWTAPFSTTSVFEGDWQVGSVMKFISLDEDGNQIGQVARVNKNIENKLIELEHFGWIKDGDVITEGEEVEEFKGAREVYSINTMDDSCVVSIETDVFIAHEDYFVETWPKSLNVLKDLAES